MNADLANVTDIDASPLCGDLHELNFAYLCCLRELGRVNVNEATLRFGVEPSVVHQIVNSSIAQLKEIADPAFLQVKMRASSTLKKMLKNEKDPHAKLLNTISLMSEANDSHE